jgi:predicted nucleic acid-binding protein
MAVIDASVYLALVNTDEAGHKQSWHWFEQATLMDLRNE